MQTATDRRAEKLSELSHTARKTADKLEFLQEPESIHMHFLLQLIGSPGGILPVASATASPATSKAQFTAQPSS